MLRFMLSEVERFQREIIGLPIPQQPTMLADARLKFRCDHVREEIDEVLEATTIEDQVDGFIDAIYIALGALIEMGVLPGPVFEEVHAANMKKKRGSVAKRPGSVGYDAVKPEGWTPPDLTPYMTISRNEAATLVAVRDKSTEA